MTLTDVALIDELEGLGELSYTWSTTSGELALGEELSATAQYELTQAEVDAGEVVNVAILDGTTPAGDTVSDDDPVQVSLSGLAVTGASILTAVGIALALLVPGIFLMRARDRKETV